MGTPVQQLFDLTGQVALVTGGSRGLGLQMAEALGEAGAKIMLTSRKAADLEEAAAHLSDTRHRRALDRRRRQRPGADPEGGRRDHAAPGPHRHPRQQRRRHLGRAGRGLPAGGLGQGDEPEYPQPVPVRAGGRQGQHDPEPARPHHQRGLDRRPGRQHGRAVHRLRHEQGRGGQFHAHAGRPSGAATASPSMRWRRASSRAR